MINLNVMNTCSQYVKQTIARSVGILYTSRI